MSFTFKRMFLAGALLVTAASAHSAAGEVPLEIQLPLLFKALGYDDNLDARTPGDVAMIAVLLSDDAQRESFLAAAKKIPNDVNGKNVNWMFIDTREIGLLKKVLEAQPVTAIYVSDDQAEELSEIVALAQKHQVVTLAANPAFLEQKLSVAVTGKDGKPRLLVNLPSARAEGCQFSSTLLSLSLVDVVR